MIKKENDIGTSKIIEGIPKNKAKRLWNYTGFGVSFTNKKMIETHPCVHPFIHLVSQVILTPSKNAKINVKFDMSLALLIYDMV